MAGIYRRKGHRTWYGRVEHKGKDHRKSLETDDRKVARQRLEQWVEELKKTQWGEKPRLTYDDAAKKFITEHLPLLKGGIEGRTAKGYLRALVLLAETFEGVALEDIGSGKLSEYEQYRRRQGVTSGTIRGDLWVLSSVLSRAEEWEWVTGNPVAAYLRSRAKQKLLLPAEHRTRYLSHEEEATILSRCRGLKTLRKGSSEPGEAGEEVDHIMLAAGIAITIDVGLRKEELLSAVWDNIDLERREWTVPPDVAKSGRMRVIPILPRSLAILERMPRSQDTSHVLWHTERGRATRYTDILPALDNVSTGGRSRIIRREMTKLSLKRIEPTDKEIADIRSLADANAWAPAIEDLIWHDLRRTCGCRLLQDHRLSMEEVSKWLGHSSVKVTEASYAFLNVRHLHQAVERGAIEKRDFRRLEAPKFRSR